MINKYKISFEEAEKIAEKIDNWVKRKGSLKGYITYSGSIGGIEAFSFRVSGFDSRGFSLESYCLSMNYQKRNIAYFEYDHTHSSGRDSNIKAIYDKAKEKYEDSKPENIKFRKELSDVVKKLTK